MAKLSYSERALTDLERLADFLIDNDPAAAAETLELIEEAVNSLIRHPLVGRPVEYGLRELVISRGHTGYVALYSLEKSRDAILILAIRRQREAGYFGQEAD
ncbi:MAG: type II toxin-antitoxin system RelE/ParE family toxin [Nitrosospira sp.]|nr:type II toxin-antitoxin system RelE/ParE family toxin [Nitrosospira sp.]